MRTFIALELSDEIKGVLADLQGQLKPAGADVKWVKPFNVHLTVKFLGEIEEERADRIKRVLDEVSAQNGPFELKLFKLGAFPSMSQPRIIWLGTGNGCVEAETIARSVEEGMEKLGFPKEERPFRAHLTLGRVKSGKNKEQLKERLSSTVVQPQSCTIDHITLFKSTLTPQGPIYTPLHVSKLNKV